MISLDCVTLERRNISFGPVSRTFKEGECVAVMGENGAGKTTLLDLISGLETPSSGAVDSSSRVSYAPQESDDSFFLPTVLDEFSYSLRCVRRGLSVREEAERLLVAVGLDSSYLSQSPFSLSGGEKRRLNLATLDAISPKLFIYDEAFDELSASWRKRLLELMREKEYVLVLGSHYLFEYENFFESTYELCDGSLFPYEKRSVPFVFPRSKVGLGKHTLEISNLTFSQSHRAMREKKTFDLTVPTMRIESGRAYLLEGENGAGKSTLARLIAGILEKRGGSITYDGKAVDEKRRKTLVSYLFQNPFNQLYLPRVQDELMSVSSSPEEAERVADLFSLSLTDYTEELSYGKAKMLQAAIYYILNRPFAIFDEVDSAISYRDTMSLLTLYLERGSGVLMISHDKRIISSFGGRIYHMREGRLE